MTETNPLAAFSVGQLREELLARYKVPTLTRLQTPIQIRDHMWPLVAGLEHETFHVLCLSSRNALLAHEVVAIGSVDQCHVDPRRVFTPAVLSNCTGMVIVHNHPSGDPEPSVQDVALTRQLVQGARNLCIRVLDHLVIGAPNVTGGEPRWVSMLARGLLKDNEAAPAWAAEKES